MPAHRSKDEGLIRDAAVARIREMRPQARIIHEINCGSFGPVRMDFIAVSPEEIIACEIKSKKDKLDRLPKQIEYMNKVAHQTVVAFHEKFLVEQKTNRHAAHYERDGEYFLGANPPEINHRVRDWVYPERDRRMTPETLPGYTSHWRWKLDPHKHCRALPQAALHLLWRDELYALCFALRIGVGKRATMPEMVAELRWNCSGKELTRGICAALRRRECVEADPAIIEAA